MTAEKAAVDKALADGKAASDAAAAKVVALQAERDALALEKKAQGGDSGCRGHHTGARAPDRFRSQQGRRGETSSTILAVVPIRRGHSPNPPGRLPGVGIDRSCFRH